MLLAFSIAPSGGIDDPSHAPESVAESRDSVVRAVADAVRVVRESGLPHHTDAMFTTIEGEWDECFDVVRRAVEAVSRHSSRVALVLKADIRPGRSGELTGKVQRLEEALAASAAEDSLDNPSAATH
ncbi:MAG: thiamine-binding protein [Actinomycetota bacterium]